MEQPAASEIAQHGDQIEVTAPGRIDYGKRFQVESSSDRAVIVLDNRKRIGVAHSDYKIVKRCGKPATEAPKKVGRPSNAERDARIAAQVASCAVKPPAVTPKAPAAPVVTKAELAALEKALNYPPALDNEQIGAKVESSLADPRPSIPHAQVMAEAKQIVMMQGQRAGKTTAALEQVKQAIESGKVLVSPFAEQVKASHSFPASSELAKRSPIEELERSNAEHPDTVPNAQVGDIIKITAGEHITDPHTKYHRGHELRVTGSGTEVVNARQIGYSPVLWNFVVKHSDYEIVATAAEEKALQDVRVAAFTPAQEQIDAASENLKPLYGAVEPSAVKLTQEQFDAMTRQAMEVPKHMLRHQQPKHNHYFKDSPFDQVDVYRVLVMFNVTDPCIQHAVKKLLVAGGRGHKDIAKDVQDSIDSLERWKEMRDEEQAA